jgi:hypothetical protein
MKNEYMPLVKCECVLSKQHDAERLTKEKDIERLNKFKNSYIHYPLDELHPNDRKKVILYFLTIILTKIKLLFKFKNWQ